MDTIPFCPDVKQVAFTVLGYEVGLITVIWLGLLLTFVLSMTYRLATRYSSQRYTGVPE